MAPVSGRGRMASSGGSVMGHSLPQNTNIYLVIRTNCCERMRLFPYKIYFFSAPI